ncbi:hypothetical protein AS263_15475 [Enterococcus faecium]|nr:hypothetical protein AS263_15475 [Enterococcus faecium]
MKSGKQVYAVVMKISKKKRLLFEQISMHCQSKKKRISLLLLSMKVICMHVVMTDIWRCF